MSIATRAKAGNPGPDDYGPRYESGGWIHWPQHNAHSIQLQRLLGSAQDGAAFISECFLTAQRIDVGCDESWCAEWIALARRTRARALHLAGLGHPESAGAAWLRATNYFVAARSFLPRSDTRWAQLYQTIEECSLAYLGALFPNGKPVEIPFEDYSLCGHYLPSSAASGKAPVVVCCGGPSDSKETQLLKFPKHALSRGLSLLVVDLPGQGASLLRNDVPRHDVESAISACVDYLIQRTDIDVGKVALYGDGLGGATASRAASLDKRFAAAVCDGGAWELRERMVVQDWLFGERDAEKTGGVPYHSVSPIQCPFLVMAGAHDYLERDEIRQLYRYHRDLGADVCLKIFSDEETGASHAQNDNPSIGAEFAFDWLADKLSCG